MNKNGHIPDLYSLHFSVLVTWPYSTGMGGGGVLYVDRHHPNAFPFLPSATQDGPDEANTSVTWEMHLLKEENSARTLENYTSKRMKGFHVFQDQKTAHTTLICQEIIEGGKKTNS